VPIFRTAVAGLAVATDAARHALVAEVAFVPPTVNVGGTAGKTTGLVVALEIHTHRALTGAIAVIKTVHRAADTAWRGQDVPQALRVRATFINAATGVAIFCSVIGRKTHVS